MMRRKGAGDTRATPQSFWYSASDHKFAEIFADSLSGRASPCPTGCSQTSPKRVAQFARWAKQVRHEVGFRRRQHGESPSSEEGGSSAASAAGPMPSGAVPAPREMEGLTNSLQSRLARLRREAPLHEEKERGIRNSSSSSSNSSDEKPRPSGSNAGPKPSRSPTAAV